MSVAQWESNSVQIKPIVKKTVKKKKVEIILLKYDATISSIK